MKFIKECIKRMVYPIIGFSVPNHNIDLYKTLVVNLKLFGFKGGKIMPIIIYKNTKIYSLGKIVFQCPLQKGLLTIGKLDIKSQGHTKFNNKGKIIISGFVEIGGCTIIDNVGEIYLEGCNRISDGTRLIIREKLLVGEQTNLGFGSFLMDSDDHFCIDVESRKIFNNNKAIQIGKCCWVGSNTYIKKGAVLPDYTIVASANALVAKDYSNIPPYSVLGGAPAKVIKSGIRRVRYLELEMKLKKYFKENPASCFQCDEKVDLDEICKQRGGDF